MSRYPCAVQEPGEGTDAAFARCQSGAGYQRPEPAPARLGRIFRLQSVAGADNARCLGAAEVALSCLGAMEDDAAAHCGAVSSRGRQVGGLRGVQSCQRAVAPEFLQGLARCVWQGRLPRYGLGGDGQLRQSLIRRTAVVRTRMPGGEGGEASRGAPLSRLTAIRVAEAH